MKKIVSDPKKFLTPQKAKLSLCHFFLKPLLIALLGFFFNFSNAQHADQSTAVSKSLDHYYIDFNVAESAKIKDAILTKNTSSKTFQLFSHGKPGQLFLNNQWKNAEEISEWLSNNYNVAHYSNLNIYGCNFAQGEKGKTAVAYLETTLGITIAASDDITGFNGDWELEVGEACNAISMPNYKFNLQCVCEFRRVVIDTTWFPEDDCSLSVCARERISMRGPGGGGNVYEWTDASGNVIGNSRVLTIESAVTATYNLSVNDGANCTASFNIQTVGADVSKTNASCSGIDNGEIAINNPIGSGNYTYSIDGTNFQASNTFSNLPTGIYTAYLRDNDLLVDCAVGQAVIEANPVTAYALSASCTNGAVNDDAFLQISIAQGDSYHFSVGSTFDDNGGANTYSNATTIATTPLTFGNLPNPNSPTDYTIRVYNGANDCFSDVTVVLQPQDCTQDGCDCSENIYLNDRLSGAVYKFEVNPADGSLNEISTNGNRWYPNGGISELPSPHGLGIDINGSLYIGETSTGNIRKFTCDGEIAPATEFEIVSGGQNFATLGNVLYVSTTTESPDGIYAYDLCTGEELGHVILNNNPAVALNDNTVNWGFHIGSDGTFYSTSASNRVDADNFLWKYTPTLADFASNTAYNPLILPADMPVGNIFGVTTDSANNIYVVSRPTAGNSGMVTKYDANGVFVAATPIDAVNGDGGYANAIGITYSASSGFLYTSNGSNVEDCISIIDPVTMTYVGVGAPPPPGAGNFSPKGISIVEECCPTSNIVVADTTVCGASVGDALFLQDFITCPGVICEGSWQNEGDNPGFSFDSCNNSLTINAFGCGSYALKSDGIGSNSKCGAFITFLNVCVGPPTPPQISITNNICTPETAGTINVDTPCAAGSTIEFSVDGGVTWSATQPSYGTDDITVRARCVNDSEDGCVSTETADVTTAPEVCDTCPPVNCIRQYGEFTIIKNEP